MNDLPTQSDKEASKDLGQRLAQAGYVTTASSRSERRPYPSGRTSTRGRAAQMVVTALIALCSGIAIGRGMVGEKALTSSMRGEAGLSDAEPQQAKSSREVSAAGFIQPKREATVSSDQTGRLSRIYVHEGQKVVSGELLAVLSDEQERMGVRRAQSELDTARARQAEAEIKYRATTPDYGRNVLLFRHGFATAQSVEQAKAQMDQGAAELETARKIVQGSEEAVQNAQLEVQRRRIVAPFTGYVSDLNAQVGEIVSPSSGASGFTRSGICTLTDRSQLFADLEVDERRLSDLSGLHHAIVRVPALGIDVKGTVDPDYIQLDKARGAIHKRVLLINPPLSIMPNMAVDATLIP